MNQNMKFKILIQQIRKNYIVFSGIGNHSTFIDTLKKNQIKIIEEIEYPDHYQYKKMIQKKILKIAKNKNAKVLTTEKFIYVLIKNTTHINFIKVFKNRSVNKLKKKLRNLYENN